MASLAAIAAKTAFSSSSLNGANHIVISDFDHGVTKILSPQLIGISAAVFKTVELLDTIVARTLTEINVSALKKDDCVYLTFG